MLHAHNVAQQSGAPVCDRRSTEAANCLDVVAALSSDHLVLLPIFALDLDPAVRVSVAELHVSVLACTKMRNLIIMLRRFQRYPQVSKAGLLNQTSDADASAATVNRHD